MNLGSPAPNEAAITEALQEVYDPCSVASKVALSVADMGLIHSVDIDGGIVVVETIMTTPFCTQAPLILDAIRARISAIEGVDEVVVNIRRDLMWGPEMMSASATERLERRRERARQVLQIESPSAARERRAK
jgi:ring-1,2-phenylacetyl-CoA epoxidase subunit PaaD